jgi:tRNA nucleotidyltransferase (CCA-adding enzyme)
VRFAALTHDLGKATTPADILPRHHGHEARSVRLADGALRVRCGCPTTAAIWPCSPRATMATSIAPPNCGRPLVTLLEKTDALRRPARFQQLLEACQCDFNGRLGWADRPYDSPRLLAHLPRCNER